MSILLRPLLPILLAAGCWPTALLAATDGPDFDMVTGVAADDVPKPRSGPLADAEKIGSIALDELSNIAYSGIYERSVTLVDGVYEGEPFVPGGASRPRLELLKGLYATGDIDGDGVEGAWVLLNESSGGSGEFLYLAAVTTADGKLRNAGTLIVGDRVNVIALRGANSQVSLDYVAAAPGEAACCPTLIVSAVYGLKDGELTELSRKEEGKLGLDRLAGGAWRLVQFGRNDPVPEGVVIEAKFEKGRISGSAGCNRYNANLEAPTPYELKVGPVIATRIACPEPQMEAESRFLKALEGASRFGFDLGKLTIGYEEGENYSTLVLER